MSGERDEEERLQRFEAGRAIEVPVARIEHELTALWRQAARGRQGEPPRAVTRACLWNVIARVAADDRIDRVRQLMDELSAQLSARVIVLYPGAADAPDALSAYVEANWRPTPEGGVIGSDEVTLVAAGPAIARLGSVVRAILVPDAPTAMLWLGALPERDAPARGLLREADRLVVDTRRLPSEADLVEVLELARGAPDLEVADLAWLGGSPLRGLCASMFDPPRDPARLYQLDRVRVVAGVKGTQARALLLLGWLAARLDWSEVRRAESAEPDTRGWQARRRDGGEVRLELSTRTTGAKHGVVALELDAGDEGWTLVREHGCIEVRAPGLPPRMQPARSHRDVELVVSALGGRGRDGMFRAALEGAVALVSAR